MSDFETVEQGEERRHFNLDGKCLHEGDFRRLDTLVTKVFEKMDRFIDDLHQARLADSVSAQHIEVLQQDVKMSFAMIRAIKDDFKVISDWRMKFEGAIKAMLAIPIMCTVITTGVAIYSILK